MKLFAWGSGFKSTFKLTPEFTGLSGEVSLGKSYMFVRQPDGTVLHRGRSLDNGLDNLYAAPIEGKWKVAKADGGLIDEEGRLFSVDFIETGKHEYPWEEIHIHKGELLLVDSKRHLYTLHRGKPDLLSETSWSKVEVRKGDLWTIAEDGKVFRNFEQVDEPLENVVYGEHCVFTIVDGDLHAQGDNLCGKLGVGDQVHRKDPAQVEGKWKSVHTSGKLTVGVKEDDSVWEWGFNEQDDRHMGISIKDAKPPEVNQLWKTAACGDGYTLAIRQDGKLYAWGSNAAMQLGLGHRSNREEPSRVGISSWKAVACGFCSLAIREDGRLFGWGYEFKSRPTQIGNEKWKSIACNVVSWVGVRQDGMLMVKDKGRQAPEALSSDTDWETVSMSPRGMYGLALKRDGRLYSWGSNLSGQLGLGDTNFRSFPTLVSGGWKEVVAGENHALGIHEDGSVYGWGDNFNGQVSPFGDPKLLEPVWVMEDKVIGVACGLRFSVIVTSDYNIHTFGNAVGKSPGKLEWKKVFGGSFHTLVAL